MLPPAPRSAPTVASPRRAAFALARRWRRHELLAAWRRFRAHKLRDQLAVAIGTPLVLSYALATAATVLRCDRPILLAHPFAAATILAAADAVLAFAAAMLLRRHGRRRLAAPWLAVLPLDPAVLRTLATFDAALVLLPVLALLLGCQAAILLPSGVCCLLLPAACAGIAAGLVPVLRHPGRSTDDGTPSAAPSRNRRRRAGPLLFRLDRTAPRHLSNWCARLNRPLRARLPLLPAPLAVAIPFIVLPAPQAAAALPLAAVPCGVIAFAATLRTAPLASASLRTLPLSYPRLLFGVSRVPLLVSLLATTALSCCSALFAPTTPARVLSAPAYVLVLDLSFAVFSCRWPGRDAFGAGAWATTAAVTAWESPKFGLSVLLLPAAILALMIRRGLREQPLGAGPVTGPATISARSRPA